MKKTTIITIDTLTNTAAANLNRDDAGNVKVDGDRLRISSQCLKRHVRGYFVNISEKYNSVRSKLIPSICFARASKELDYPVAEEAVLSFFGIKKPKDGKEYQLTTLVFLSQSEIDTIYKSFKASVEYCHENEFTGKKIESYMKEKKKEIGLLAALKEGGARYGVIISLFGRMFADDPSMDVEAAASFKHSRTVQDVQAEKDFFTAVDDRQAQGSGHLGIAEMGTGTFYGCNHLNLDLLASNLGLEKESAELKEIVNDYLLAVLLSFPKAKKNSNLASNLPFFARVRVLEGSGYTMDDAFMVPVDTYEPEVIISKIKDTQKAKDDSFNGVAYNVIADEEFVTGVSLKGLIEKVIKYV